MQCFVQLKMLWLSCCPFVVATVTNEFTSATSNMRERHRSPYSKLIHIQLQEEIKAMKVHSLVMLSFLQEERREEKIQKRRQNKQMDTEKHCYQTLGIFSHHTLSMSPFSTCSHVTSCSLLPKGFVTFRNQVQLYLKMPRN